MGWWAAIDSSRRFGSRTESQSSRRVFDTFATRAKRGGNETVGGAKAQMLRICDAAEVQWMK